MSSNLIYVKDYLGKYFPELHYSSIQDKYKDTKLDTLFDQRFYIQNNRTQMIVDASMPGLALSITGNEIYISKELYDHPSVNVSNSLEKPQTSNPRGLFNSETFGTVAYLMCQNHLTIEIVDAVDEPIYVKYRSEFETFHSAVVIFSIGSYIDVEIVEEIESQCALNVVTNYNLMPNAKLGLSTFYKNNISASSIYLREVTLQESTDYSHILLGQGSAGIIDENKIHVGSGSKIEMLGVINSNGRDFHTILYLDPPLTEYKATVVYKDILVDSADVSFFPIITQVDEISENVIIEVSNIILNDVPDDRKKEEVSRFISDIVGRALINRVAGAKRFYNSKDRFLQNTINIM